MFYIVLDDLTIEYNLDIQILAPLPIGFAVFLVHLATIPITGTGINPARSLGAALIYNKEHAWDDHVSNILYSITSWLMLKKKKVIKISYIILIWCSTIWCSIDELFFGNAVDILGRTSHWSRTRSFIPSNCDQSPSL